MTVPLNHDPPDGCGAAAAEPADLGDDATERHRGGWERPLATAIERIGDPGFEGALLAAVASLAPPDASLLMFTFARGQAPRPYFLGDPDPRTRSSISEYLSGPYLLDPYYLAGSSGRNGCYRLSDIAPDGFRRSRYYREYYARTRLDDEVGYLLDAGPERFAHISVGIERGRLTARSAATLVAALPVLEALAHRHWSNSRPPHQQPNLPAPHATLGADVLTTRERETVDLILRGHSTKSAARALGIAPETLKLHRKHAYAKLGVASQAELFAAFLRSLT